VVQSQAPVSKKAPKPSPKKACNAPDKRYQKRMKNFDFERKKYIKSDKHERMSNSINYKFNNYELLVKWADRMKDLSRI